jgi:hypothetical protein
MSCIIQKLATTVLSSLLAIVVCLAPTTVAAATRYWKNSVASPGNWTTGNNWSATSATGLDFGGAPGANDAVNIRLTDGANHTITYDYAGAAITLAQLNVDVTGAGTTTATLSMSANNLTSNNEWIGYSGRGTFEQSGGTNTIAVGTGSFNFLDIGVFAGSKGTYNLSGTGSLVVDTIEYVGDVGTGVFNQTGGTNSITGPTPNLYLGYNVSGTGGTYNLSGGALSTIEGLEAVGYKSVGTFNQSGGTNDANYLSVGENATGTYTLSGGTLSLIHYESIGHAAAGTFNHTGGTNNAGYEFDLGGLAGSSGTYSLSGTGILTASTEYIGFAGQGTFTQTGGMNSTEILYFYNGTYTLSGTGVLTVTDRVEIDNVPGNSLNLNGGTINAAKLDFHGAPTHFNWTSGTLNVTQNVVWDPAGTDSTSVVFGSMLTLGANKTLMITGNETLGGTGAFGLTLNSGSTHHVTGGIMLSPTGTITQNAGSTLTYSTFSQAGGAFNGTLQNQGKFIYQSGQFNGQMVNNSGAYLVVAGEFNPSNLVNNGDMVVINTTVGGPIINNHTVTVVGDVNFNGQVSGPGDFFGPGTAHFNGGIAPGASPAEVSFEGSLALADTNTLFVEIAGNTPGSQYDRLTIAGSASLDGTLNVSLVNGFTPGSGQQFTILAAGSIVDNGLVLAGPAAGSFSLIVNSTSVILQAIGLPGDYNHNGIVDVADYVIWRKGFGTIYTQNEYTVWRSHFGQTAGSGPALPSAEPLSASVPEPATLVLLIFAAPGPYLRRRQFLTRVSELMHA